MLAGKELALFEEEGRNPVGIVLVDAPRQVKKGMEISIGGDREDLHSQITPRSLPTIRNASKTRSMWAFVWVAI